MKVYILIGYDPNSVMPIICAVTLFKDLKPKIMDDYKHAFPYSFFEWRNHNLIEENENENIYFEGSRNDYRRIN